MMFDERNFPMHRIMTAVCEAYGVPIREFRSKRRHRQASQARAAFCYWTRLRTGYSYPQIGRFLDLDHTTVQYHCRNYLRNVLRYEDDRAYDCTMRVNRPDYEAAA